MKRALLLVVLISLVGTVAYAAPLPVTVWSDGFESGLINWSFFNPSGDNTAFANAVGTYTSYVGTCTPPAGQKMAQIYKEDGGLAYLISNPITVTPGTIYQIDLKAGGLGEYDDCGFRWNKWGYSLDGTTLTWVSDNFRTVNPLQTVAGYQCTATGSNIYVLLGLDRSCRDGLGHSAFFDAVQVTTNTPVPEPGSLLVLSSGLLALGAAIRRRR